MTENAQTRRTDDERIDTIITAIKERYPDVVAFEVSSSDQGSGGYDVTDLYLADGTVVEDDAIGSFLADDLWEDAIWLRWGAFGDGDMDSVFKVDMTTRKIIH